MIKAGDVIKIENPDHQKMVDKLMEDQSSSRMAFVTASEMVRQSHDRLWAYLHELYPETIGRSTRYCLETRTIEVMGKLPTET